MGGDEKGTCGTAVCDAGDEAVTSGDVAPAPVDAASAKDESDEASTFAAAPVEADAGPVADALVEADADPVDEAGPEDAPGEFDLAPTAAATDAAPPVTRTRRPYLRRGAVALLTAGFVALGLGAYAWVAPSPERADRRFVEAAQSQGHAVAPGEQQALVVSAARKVCDRRFTPETVRERRATALTTDELAAVGAAFGAATRDFTRLALKTYCSS